MRKTFVAALAVSTLLLVAAVAGAMPVDLPSNAKTQRGVIWTHIDNRLEVSLDVKTEFLTDRKADDIDFSGSIYSLKVTLCPGNMSFEGFDFYLIAGSAVQLEVDATLADDDVKFDMENQFIGGLGISQVFTPKANLLQAGLRLQYRYMEADDSASITVNGADADGKASFTWHEIQVAVVLAWKLKRVVPYLGVKFSRLVVDGKVEAGGNTYQPSGEQSEEAAGLLAGLSLQLGERCALDIEGRFADEEALSVGFSFRF